MASGHRSRISRTNGTRFARAMSHADSAENSVGDEAITTSTGPSLGRPKASAVSMNDR